MFRANRRCIVKLVLLIFAGAIINIAVAWGCYIYGTQSVAVEESVDVPASHVKRMAQQLPSNATLSRTSFRYQSIGFAADRIYGELPDPRIDGAFSVPGGYQRPGCSVVEVRSGLPIHAISFIRLRDQHDSIALIGARRIGGRLMPTRPLGAGFAINTIFYAAIVWGLFAVPGVIRRRIGGVRRKRGQCAACGYSRRGTPQSEKCPECGGNILHRNKCIK
jgi:hypothetical protein